MGQRLFKDSANMIEISRPSELIRGRIDQIGIIALTERCSTTTCWQRLTGRRQSTSSSARVWVKIQIRAPCPRISYPHEVHPGPWCQCGRILHRRGIWSYPRSWRTKTAVWAVPVWHAEAYLIPVQQWIWGGRGQNRRVGGEL